MDSRENGVVSVLGQRHVCNLAGHGLAGGEWGEDWVDVEQMLWRGQGNKAITRHTLQSSIQLSLSLSLSLATMHMLLQSVSLPLETALSLCNMHGLAEHLLLCDRTPGKGAIVRCHHPDDIPHIAGQMIFILARAHKDAGVLDALLKLKGGQYPVWRDGEQVHEEIIIQCKRLYLYKARTQAMQKQLCRDPQMHRDMRECEPCKMPRIRSHENIYTTTYDNI